MRRAIFTTLIGLNFFSLGLIGVTALGSASISHNLRGNSYSMRAIDHTWRAGLEREAREDHLERAQEYRNKAEEHYRVGERLSLSKYIRQIFQDSE